jgi:hypothetical protein
VASPVAHHGYHLKAIVCQAAQSDDLSLPSSQWQKAQRRSCTCCSLAVTTSSSSTKASHHRSPWPTLWPAFTPPGLAL